MSCGSGERWRRAVSLSLAPHPCPPPPPPPGVVACRSAGRTLGWQCRGGPSAASSHRSAAIARAREGARAGRRTKWRREGATNWKGSLSLESSLSPSCAGAGDGGTSARAGCSATRGWPARRPGRGLCVLGLDWGWEVGGERRGGCERAREGESKGRPLPAPSHCARGCARQCRVGADRGRRLTLCARRSLTRPGRSHSARLARGEHFLGVEEALCVCASLFCLAS